MIKFVIPILDRYQNQKERNARGKIDNLIQLGGYTLLTKSQDVG